MASRLKLLMLLLVLSLCGIVTVLDSKRRLTEHKLVRLGAVTEIDIRIKGTKISLKRNQSTSRAKTSYERAQWSIERIDEKPPGDARANSDLVNHLVDLVKALRDEAKAPLDASQADAYGMKNPELEITLHSQSSREGSETVLFGHRDLSGLNVFAFFPARKLLVQAPSAAMTLVENKTPHDIRDRHITTFDPDDVEDLVAGGKCGSIELTRDGDQWLSQKKIVRHETVDLWLNSFLGTFYEELENALATAETNPVCTIRLTGRRGRNETIEIFKADGTLWAQNSALTAVYRLPRGFLEKLIPPR